MARIKSQKKVSRKPGAKATALSKGKAKAAAESRKKASRQSVPAGKAKPRQPLTARVAKPKAPPPLPSSGAKPSAVPIAPAGKPDVATATPPPPIAVPAAKRPRVRKPITLPPILLEGDAPPTPVPSGPGERYAVGPIPRGPAPSSSEPVSPSPHQIVARAPEIATELPESYGTERLFLTARDPHWLYAAWDLTPERRRRYNAASREGHMAVRAYVNDTRGALATEAQVHPESKSWFVHVATAGTRYVAQLGFYEANGVWHPIVDSTPTLTPPDSLSEPSGVEFATIPPDVTLKKLFEVVQEAVSDSVPLIEAVQQLRAEGWTELPIVKPSTRVEWTPAQARALAEVVRLDDSRRVWMGSLEITELVRRHLQREVSSPGPVVEAAEAIGPLPSGPPVSAVSSPRERPAEAAGLERQFWFNVNAELILYGRTEPDAKVTIGGREIRLRPDGTFSYRFALPDGQYPLEIKAATVDGLEQRSARLEFRRSTEFSGNVGAHPQDAALRPPTSDSVA